MYQQRIFFADCERRCAQVVPICRDKPSDKATLDLTVKVPATVKLGSNGRLEDSIKTAIQFITTRWLKITSQLIYLSLVEK
ncbi:MAG: hypothetical protein IPJ03_14650 [Ignavibacteriales bacterium]|nr:hypothetical protein [Ignavibacteriales bacterium]